MRCPGNPCFSRQISADGCGRKKPGATRARTRADVMSELTAICAAGRKLVCIGEETVITKSGAVSSWLAGIVSSFQGGDRGVPPCSSARFGLGPLPRGGPVSVPPAAVRVRAVLPRQAQNGSMSHGTFEGVGPRQPAFPTWHVLMRRDSRRPRPGPSGSVGTRARSTEVGADYGGARARRLRSGIASAALVAVAFLVAACGGGSSPAAVAHIGKSAPTTTVPPAAGSGGLPNLQQLYQSTLA
jgi:hypothetical protein